MSVRDYSSHSEIVAAIEKARDTIIGCWDEWEMFAGQEEYDGGSWFDSMNAQLDCVLFGMLDEIPLEFPS